MEFNETQTMAINFTKMAKEKMGDKVKDFCISDVYDDVNNRAFSVEFTAYDYFPIRLNYERGRFGCCILYGERTVALSNSQQWWEEADFDVFFKELERELKLRIPDKFLKAHRWRWYERSTTKEKQTLRDTVMNEKYFREYILEETGRIKNFQNKLENNEVREDRIYSVKRKIDAIQFELLIARYSSGEDIEKLENDFANKYEID